MLRPPKRYSRPGPIYLIVLLICASDHSLSIDPWGLSLRRKLGNCYVPRSQWMWKSWASLTRLFSALESMHGGHPDKLLRYNDPGHSRIESARNIQCLIPVLIANSTHSSIHNIVILAGSHDTAVLAVHFMLALRDWEWHIPPQSNHSPPLPCLVPHPLRVILIRLISCFPFFLQYLLLS